MPDSGWITAYEWALIIAVAGQTVFLVVYGTRPWWKHYVGKALFFKSLALGLALWISLGNVVFPGYPYQIEIAVISIWMVAVTIVGQCVALLMQVGHGRYEKKLAASGADSDTGSDPPKEDTWHTQPQAPDTSDPQPTPPTEITSRSSGSSSTRRFRRVSRGKQ